MRLLTCNGPCPPPDCWRQRAAQGDPLSWLPPEEVGLGESPLTSDLAAASSNVEMLALLVAHGRCQLSFRGVRLLVRRWEEVPAKDGGALVRVGRWGAFGCL